MIIPTHILRTYLSPNRRSKTQLFENLDHDFLHTLFEHSMYHSYEADRLLVQQGDTPAFLYLIIKGSVKTSRINKEGDESTIRLLSEGETCMDATIFMDGPSPINVQVIDDAELLLIPSNFVKTQAIANTQFATNLIKIVTKHYKSALHLIDGIAIKSPVQRVGFYLLEQHLKCNSNSLEFQLPFKKSIIANHLGMQPETFSRALSQIKDMGIDVQQETIRMQDYFSLCRFCDSELAYICNHSAKSDCPNCPLN